MGLKLKVFFSFLLLIISTQASAAYYQPYKGGFYLGAFGGANWMHIKNWYHDINADCKSKYYGGGALGYTCYTSPFRLEAEVAYRTNTLEHFKVCGIKYSCDVHTHTWSYMGNILYDLDCSLIKPYAGFGIGYVHTHTPKVLNMVLEGSVGDPLSLPQPEPNNDGVAWQAIGGISYPFLSCLDIAIEYRYFQASEENQNHSLGVALRSSF